MLQVAAQHGQHEWRALRNTKGQKAYTCKEWPTLKDSVGFPHCLATKELWSLDQDHCTSILSQYWSVIEGGVVAQLPETSSSHSSAQTLEGTLSKSGWAGFAASYDDHGGWANFASSYLGDDMDTGGC